MRRKKSSTSTSAWLLKLFGYVHGHVVTLNNSKFFAGIMIILLNVASKFANFKLSKSMESYLKHTFSRLVLVFAIAWVGTRDIYTALIICVVFTVSVDFLFNEESRFCCLTESFTTHHESLLNYHEGDSSDKEDHLQAAIDSLQKAKTQKGQQQQMSSTLSSHT